MTLPVRVLILGILAAPLPAAADIPEPAQAWLSAPGVRLIALRAEGAAYRWRDLPQPPGLRLGVLSDCRGSEPSARVCDPDRRYRRALGLADGEAAVWDWRGRPVALRAGPHEVRAAIGRQLGPRPRVWIDADTDADRRRAVAEALTATGRWSVTHRIQDARALEKARRGEHSARPRCVDSPPVPSVSLLRVRGARAEWVDADGACVIARATGRSAKALIAALEAEWRQATDPGRIPPRAPPPLRGRQDDDHLRAKVRKSFATLDALGETPLTEAVRRWIGVRYVRDGATADGVDDFNLVRSLYRDVYGISLGDNPLDWLTAYEKIPVDESRPEATVRPGDILFKVTLAYRPREVLVYVGDGYAVSAKEVEGVVIAPVPKLGKSVKYYLVARRPHAALGQR